MLPPKYTKIDGLVRPNHKCLTAADNCFFLGEYTSGAGYGTPTNDLIHNFKIRPSELRANPKRQRYKDAAINEIGTALASHLGNSPAGRLIVPIPPSKVPGHVEYGDRLIRALRAGSRLRPLSWRELIKQRQSTQADHEGGRQTYGSLRTNCYIDENCALPVPNSVVLVDDVITDGKHFRVCKELILHRYGDMQIFGFFIARRIWEDVTLDFDDLDPDF